VVVDNLDAVMPRGSSREADRANAIKAEAFSHLVELAKCGVHIVIVFQPNKVDPGEIINSGKQKGTSQIYQDSDNYLNVNAFGSMTRRAEVEKSRANKKGLSKKDRFIWLSYNAETNACSELSHEGAEPPQEESELP
jgi:hypothetical protein